MRSIFYISCPDFIFFSIFFQILVCDFLPYNFIIPRDTILYYFQFEAVFRKKNNLQKD